MALPVCGLPTELWDLVLSNSSLADLCTCRAVHPYFRSLIDDKNMRRLKRAFQHSGLPSLASALVRFGGSEEVGDNLPSVLKTSSDGTDSLAYIQLLGFGYCKVCGAQTGELPLSSDLKVRVCGKSDCTAALYSAKFSHDEWSGGEPGQYEFFIASEASEFLPYIRKLDDDTPPTRGTHITYCHGTYLERPAGSRYILSDISQASRELSDVGLDFMSQDEAWSLSDYPVDPGAFDSADHDGTLRLLETWKKRATDHHALETASIFIAIAEWQRATAVRRRSVHEENLRTLRTAVSKMPGVSLEDILGNPLTQRILAAHARDGANTYAFTFRDLSRPSKDNEPEQQQVASPSRAVTARPVRQEKASSSGKKSTASVVKVNLQYRCGLCRGKRFSTYTELLRHKNAVHCQSTSRSGK